MCFLILTLTDTIYIRKNAKEIYTIDMLLLLIVMLMFTYETVCIYTIIITMAAIAIQLILKRICIKKNKCVKKQETVNTKIPIGFYMCIANIVALIVSNLYIFYYL